MQENETPDVKPEGESSTPPEEVSSPEVKQDQVQPEVKQPEVKQDDEVGKLRDQIGNLNIALKKEREEGGRRVEELTRKLEETSSVYDRMKQVFSPSEPEEEQPVYATKQELEAAVNEKILQLKEEQVQNQKIEAYKQEIKTLEEKWDGKDGKPKYDDEAVLNWQRENNKIYLSPQEAFLQMKHSEILDYEVKQKLASAKPVQNVETQVANPTGNELPEDKTNNANLNTRKAILEAIEEASKEM